VQAARRTLAGAVPRTPMLPAPKLSALTGADVFVKYENMQVTNSFKDRGAYVKLASLSSAERNRGVIAMSIGNHAQAVAYHSQRLGIPATIVMPVTTPFAKVKSAEAYGAEVVLDGETLSERQDRAAAIAHDHALILVPPYDDPAIIAGQGTVALEMFEEVGDLEMLVVPIGGGGLIAGNAIAARGVQPSVEIVGVEATLYPSMRNAITGANSPVGGPTLAEGIAVNNVGSLTLPVVRELVSDIILVDEAHLERAVNAYLTLQKVMVEGAGAAGLAAMLAAPERFRDRKVGLILCGGNIDPHPRLDHGARTRTRAPHRVVPAHHRRPPRRARADRDAVGQARRQHSRSRSPPAVSRRARQGRQARHHRRGPRPRPQQGDPARADGGRLSTGAHHHGRCDRLTPAPSGMSIRWVAKLARSPPVRFRPWSIPQAKRTPNKLAKRAFRNLEAERWEIAAGGFGPETWSSLELPPTVGANPGS
jgi:threonine dehydratase